MAGRVILTGSGGNVALGALRPLREAGLEIVGTDIEERLSAGRYTTDIFRRVDRALLDFRPGIEGYSAVVNREYISQMEELCRSYSPDSLLLNPDPEVLAVCLHREKFPVLLPSYEQKLATLDKFKAYQILEKSGVAVPEHYLPLNGKELREGVESLLTRYGAAFTNARASRGGENSAKIESPEAGRAHFKKFGEQLLIEHLPGQEFAVILTYKEGRCHLKGAFQKLKYGCGQGLKNISVDEERLFKLAEEGVEAVNRELGEKPQGTYHVDIKEDGKGKRKIMEINAGRALGGTPDSYIFYAGGINMPLIYSKLAKGEDVGTYTLEDDILQLQLNNYAFVKREEVKFWAE